MRLINKEIEAINLTFKEVFKNGKIYLFGSRVDDNKKGGDIDLYIITENKEDLTKKKIDFLTKLKDKIGNQKIDVIISRDVNRSIEKQAIKEAVELDSQILKIQKYINECKKHKIRIEKSFAKVKDIFPISSIKYEKLKDEEIEAIDQYLFRFAKLQDTLGVKLFQTIVSQYVDDSEQLTFLDILNKLEKIGILDDATIWKKLRSVRNNISHQYDDEPEEMSEALNDIFAYKNEILNILDKIDDFYKAKNKAKSE